MLLPCYKNGSSIFLNTCTERLSGILLDVLKSLKNILFNLFSLHILFLQNNQQSLRIVFFSSVNVKCLILR